METRFGKTGLMTRAMTEVPSFLEPRCRFSCHFILRAYGFVRKSSAEAFPIRRLGELESGDSIRGDIKR